jgi:hypothetical protein
LSHAGALCHRSIITSLIIVSTVIEIATFVCLMMEKDPVVGQEDQGRKAPKKKGMNITVLPACSVPQLELNKTTGQ